MTSLDSMVRCGTRADGLLFNPGAVSITDGAWNALAKHRLSGGDLLQWHCQGQWDGMTEIDRRSNLSALAAGGRIFSSFPIGASTLRVWVITEADRSSTTVLLPGEY